MARGWRPAMGRQARPSNHTRSRGSEFQDVVSKFLSKLERIANSLGIGQTSLKWMEQARGCCLR